MVAARVTTKPGVAGRIMDIVVAVSVLSENERGGNVRVRRVVQKRAGSRTKTGCLAAAVDR